MSQIILNIDDQFTSQVYAYTAAHHTTFESMTKKLWQDFLARKIEKSNDDDLLTLLESTKGIWQQGGGLEYQEKLRTEWDR